ncbi:MAG: glutamine-hydrolyzing carbamoyl-phosphate synthase small subunit [Rectinemataceae bacterium]
MKRKHEQGMLVLEDGSSYPGTIHGGHVPAAGEVVFATGMTGYAQSLTDPSYEGQILVATYPLIGNYGVPRLRRDSYGLPEWFESSRIHAAALVVNELCEAPSHHASAMSLATWMEAEQVPILSDIDTRALTRQLRSRGTMRGVIITGSVDEGLALLNEEKPEHPVASVSCRGVETYEPAAWTGAQVVLVDCGAKLNILRNLLARGLRVIRVPWDHDLEGLVFDGVVLSNGPGDPKQCSRTIAEVRRLLRGNRPVFGICLGNQILALAAGADTWKLPYGHRSQNQPCIETGTRRCFITSQNHGYAVREHSLPHGWQVWFRNANDGTIEGIRSEDGRFSAVQFHPEGCPGPRDTEFLFDRFVQTLKEAGA